MGQPARERFDAEPTEQTPVRAPYRWWSALGAAALILQAYLYGRWLLSGPQPTPRGETDVPQWMDTAVLVHLLIGLPVAAWMLYAVVIRPLRRDRRLTPDALFLLAILTLFWQDLLMNFLHYTVVYTTAWPNLGSWYGFVPGWPNPNGDLIASAAIFFWPMYAVVMFGFTIAVAPLLRRVQRRWPDVGWRGLFGAALVVAIVVNLTLEAGWARLGLYVFASTIEPLTLFSGHYYQYPLYHCLIWGMAWAALAVLRFQRDDRGSTIVERGISSEWRSPRTRTAVRFLALAGAANVIFLTYNLTTGAIHAHSGEWITDVSEKTYYTNGLCLPENATPELDYVCPGE